MGKGTVTFSDTDDGQVHVSIEFDPPVSDDEATPAQCSLMEKWERLCRMADAEEASPQDFNSGVLWAAARVVEDFDQPTIAKHLIRESGADVKDADEADAPYLAKAE